MLPADGSISAAENLRTFFLARKKTKIQTKFKNSNFQILTVATLDLVYDFEMCFETYHGSEI